ncbi:MAG: LptF/LptG family permease [Planctomycetota bacterium]
MTIIDRYLLQLFFKVLFVGFFSLMGLYVMVDTANNFDEFLNYGKQEGSFLHVLLDYFGPRVLQFFDRLGPILSLIAGMYTIACLQRTNELTAIVAGGISPTRVIRPLVIAATLVSVFGVVNREVLLPKVRSQLIYNAQNLRGENARPLTPMYDNRTDVFLDGRAAVGAERRIESPKIGLPPALSAFGQRLLARQARYQEPQADRPGGYLLENIEKPANFAQLNSGRIHGEPVLLTPKDCDWLGPEQGFLVTAVRFEQLSAGPLWSELASVFDLIEGLRSANVDYSAATRVRVHARLIQPLLDMTLFMLGLPLVFGREHRNIFVAIGWALLVVLLFVGVTLACHALGSLYLASPAVAAWLPLVLLVPPAALLAGRIWQ